MNPPLKLIRITTVPLSLKVLLRRQLHFMSRHFNVLAVSSPGDLLTEVSAQEGVNIMAVEMTRAITPVKDLKALWQLYRLLKKQKPAIVHTHTPKAGLLGMMAAKMANVPIRLHTVAGLPLMESTGNKRKVLESVEKLTYSCATKVYPNSKNLAQFILQNKFCKPEKIKVLGNGSSNGIDTQFFQPSPEMESAAAEVKERYHIMPDDFVFVFIGRLVKDKGIEELVLAFTELKKKFKGVKLLLVGPYEPELDPLAPSIEKIIEEDKDVICAGFQSDVRPYLQASNVLAFPSYREGFPNVPMQAGCFHLPSIVTNINGCNEIIENNKNGIIIAPKNKEALYAAMEQLLTNKQAYNDMKENARKMIVERYDQQHFWQLLLSEYQEQLKKATLYRNYLKRLFDFLTSFIGLLLLAPLFLVITIILSFANGGKPFFFQRRPGKNERIFMLVKFKTMNDKKDKHGNLLPDDKRLTAIGKFVRKTSLDEIPQLINVLKGDMSLIGPRPLLVEYLPLYNDFQKRRHEVRPGITGWAQVNGRNTLSWEQKFAYDVWYVDHVSFKLDLQILVKTFLKVFKAEGINSNTCATMEKFSGN